MRRPLPLYAKILAWFFLNVALLSAVFALLFSAQFHFNLDWVFLTTGARERLEAVRNLIIGELNNAPTDDWSQILDRYSEAYRVRFALFDEEAAPLIGDAGALPDEVRARMLWRPEPPGMPRDEPPSPPADRPPESPRHWRRPPVRALVRTTAPVRYWLVASARIDNPQIGDPMRVLLVARADSLGGGGLIVNARPWLALGAGAVVFSLLFWLPLVRGITRALGQMTRATRQIADGRFDVRVPAKRRDELGALGEAVNEMAARLDGFAKGQKRFLGDIAHELCAPLAKLQMALGVLEQRAAPGQENYVRSATEKAAQIASLVNELLSFSKASFGATAVRIQRVAASEAVDEAARREQTEGAQIELEIPGDLAVAADPELLVRALANLLRNAIRHGGIAGPILLRAGRAGDRVLISVADAGPGVPEEDLPRIFDAFYRVDSSRTRDTGGTGLGLTIVKTCVESCGGSVAARNREPHGLEVEIALPAAQ